MKTHMTTRIVWKLLLCAGLLFSSLAGAQDVQQEALTKGMEEFTIKKRNGKWSYTHGVITDVAVRFANDLASDLLTNASAYGLICFSNNRKGPGRRGAISLKRFNVRRQFDHYGFGHSACYPHASSLPGLGEKKVIKNKETRRCSLE